MASIQTNQFSPRSISGCQLWMDAADTTTVLTSGSTVSQWNDKSGNGRNATVYQSAPTYSPGAINFNGSQGLQMSTFFSAGSSNVAAAIVWNCTTGSSNSSFQSIIEQNASTNGSWWRFMIYGFSWSNARTGNYYGINQSGFNPVPISNFPAFTVGTSNLSFISQTSSDGTNFTFSNYTSGSLYGTQTYSGAIGTPILGTIGYNTANEGFKGTISEIILYNTIISNLQRQQLEGYLAWKWGLQTTLPSNHPFRYVPPSSTGATLFNPTLTLTTRSMGLSSSPLVFGFTPLSVARCQLWLDSSDPTTLFTSGAATLNQYVTTSPQSVSYTGPLTSVSAFTGGTCVMNGAAINGGNPLSGILAPSATPGIWYAACDVNNSKVVKMQFFFTGAVLYVQGLSAGYLASGGISASNSGATNDALYAGYAPTTIATSAGTSSYGVASFTLNHLSPTPSGSNVAQWNDKSGLARNATMFDVGFPSYNSTGNSGRPTITFGSQASFTTTIAAGTFTSGVSMFAVWYRTNAANNSESIITRTTSSGYPGPWSMAYETNPSRYIGNGPSLGFSALQSTTIPSSLNNPRVTSIVLDGTMNWNEWTNGTAYTFTSFYTQNAQQYVDTQGVVNIGARNDKGSQFNGNISEILLYQGALSTTNRQTIEGYLAWKWGLAGSLPSNHPYKNMPPGLSIPVSLPTLPTFQGASFRPTGIAGCSLWLDGADTSTMTLVGTAITQWRDKSSAANHFNTTRGTVTLTQQGSLTVAYFTSPALMTATSNITLASTGTFFVVCKLTGIDADGNSYVYAFTNLNGGDWGLLINGGASGIIGSGSVLVVNGFYNPGYPYTTFTGNYNIIYTTSWSITGSTALTFSSTVYSNVREYIGYIAEFIYYPSGISDSQRQQVEGYLAWKWGTVSSLPTNHPFKRFPPPPN